MKHLLAVIAALLIGLHCGRAGPDLRFNALR